MNLLHDPQSLRRYVYGRYKNADELSKVKAWVLIWYPAEGNIGHASIFIGAISEHRRYISWWPVTSVEKMITLSKHKGHCCNYSHDVTVEDRHPDVIYGLFNLDEIKMEEAWHSIVMKADHPSFIPLRKNCATIVQRIIKAGLTGRFPLKTLPFGFLDGQYYFWTPKRIAVVCNNLRNNKMGIKIKLSDKENLFGVRSLICNALRLR